MENAVRQTMQSQRTAKYHIPLYAQLFMRVCVCVSMCDFLYIP